MHFFKIIELLSLSTYTVNKKNTHKPRVLVMIIALLHSLAALAATFSAVTFYCYLWQWCKATAKVNFARIWCITNPTPARRVTPPWNFWTLKHLTWQNIIWPQLRGLRGLVDQATRLGRSRHPSCKRDQIKKRDYMDRWVTPPKRVTSLTLFIFILFY